jgi:hypothetical protein
MVITDLWPPHILDGFHQANIPIIPSYFIDAVLARRPNYIFFGLNPTNHPRITQLVMEPGMAFHHILTWHFDFSMTWRQ